VAAGLKEEKKRPREAILRLIQICLDDAESEKISSTRQAQFAASADRRFKFQKRGQLFIRVHNETPSVVAMCVCNPDGSPVGINR
jgi:hypothetical protein